MVDLLGNQVTVGDQVVISYGRSALRIGIITHIQEYSNNYSLATVNTYKKRFGSKQILKLNNG